MYNYEQEKNRWNICVIGIIIGKTENVTKQEVMMMKTKIFIDGSEGTTGLRIYERFQGRDDIELLKIAPELRKDMDERKRLINESDITFLCLPDDAARESVSLIENDKVKIIDASTAHRTADGWVYGLAELNPSQRQNIREAKRVAVPGCHATGFISLVYPLVAAGILPSDYPVSAFSITGYSGGGKKMIAEYEEDERAQEYSAPREYAFTQQHKHLKEMKFVTGLTREPLFSPIVADYYSGMLVSVPLYTHLLKDGQTVESFQKFFHEYYANQAFVKVMDAGAENDTKGFISGNGCTGWDGMKIFVSGNAERLVLSAQFDNLGKGASGAAVQCMNIMMGCEESKGLNL